MQGRRSSFTQIRTIADCRKCGESKPGVTAIEVWPWGHKNASDGGTTYRYHFCDECSAQIVERPLEEILREF